MNTTNGLRIAKMMAITTILLLSLIVDKSNGLDLLPGVGEDDMSRNGLSVYPPNLSDDTIPVDSPGAPAQCAKIQEVVFVVDYLCGTTLPNILTYSGGSYRYMKPPQTAYLFKEHCVNDWIHSLSNQTQLTQGDVYVASKHGMKHWFGYDSDTLEDGGKVSIDSHMEMRDGHLIGDEEICSQPHSKNKAKFILPPNAFHEILPQSSGSKQHQRIEYLIMVSTSGLSRMLTEKHLQWLYSVPRKVIWVIMDPMNENMEVIHYTAGRRANRDYFVALRTKNVAPKPSPHPSQFVGDAVPLDSLLGGFKQQQQQQQQLGNSIVEDLSVEITTTTTTTTSIPEHRSKFVDVLRSAIQNSVCCDEYKDGTQCGLCGGAMDNQASFCLDSCRSSSVDSYRYDICGVCNGDGSSCSQPIVSEMINSRVYNLNDFWIEKQHLIDGEYQIELCFHGDYFAKGTSIQFGTEGDHVFFSRLENKNSTLARLDYYHGHDHHNHQQQQQQQQQHQTTSSEITTGRWISYGNGKMCANYTIVELEGRFPGQKGVDVRVFDKHTFFKFFWNSGGKTSYIVPPERRVEFVQVDSKSTMYFAGDIGIKQTIHFRASDEMHVDSIEEFPLNDVGAIPFMLTGNPQMECVEVATTTGDDKSLPTLPFECKLDLEFDTRDALGVIVFENVKHLRIILKSQRDPKFYHVMLDEIQVFFRKHNDPYVDNQLGFKVELFQDPEQKVPFVKSKNSENFDVYGMASLRQPTYRICVDYVIRCFAFNGDVLPYDSGYPHQSGCNTPGMNVTKEILLFPNGTTTSDFAQLHSPNEFSYRFRFSSVETRFDQIIQVHWHIEPLEGSMFVPLEYEDSESNGMFAGLTDAQVAREEFLFGGQNEYRMSTFSKQIHGVMTDQRIYHNIYPFPYRTTVYSVPFPESFYDHFKEELEFHREQEENYNRVFENSLEGNLKKGKSPYSHSIHYVFYYPNNPSKSVGQYRLGGTHEEFDHYHHRFNAVIFAGFSLLVIVGIFVFLVTDSKKYMVSDEVIVNPDEGARITPKRKKKVKKSRREAVGRTGVVVLT